MTGFAGSVTVTAFPDLSSCFLKNRQLLRGLLSKI
ncbi:TPA: ABC transporter ATP-binding protein [Enterobacter bugandensis]|nr:ABC transporter ATP-binding protein [Enterobacter bugandensis]